MCRNSISHCCQLFPASATYAYVFFGAFRDALWIDVNEFGTPNAGCFHAVLVMHLCMWLSTITFASNGGRSWWLYSSFGHVLNAFPTIIIIWGIYRCKETPQSARPVTLESKLSFVDRSSLRSSTWFNIKVQCAAHKHTSVSRCDWVYT